MSRHHHTISPAGQIIAAKERGYIIGRIQQRIRDQWRQEMKEAEESHSLDTWVLTHGDGAQQVISKKVLHTLRIQAFEEIEKAVQNLLDAEVY